MIWRQSETAARAWGYVLRFRFTALRFLTAAVFAALIVAAPSAAGGAVLRVPHAALMRSCGYVNAHGGRLVKARARRACRRVARSASSAPQPTSYQNPVSANSADPGALNNNNAGSDYYVYTTGNLFPIQHSTDLLTWTSVGTALSQLPSWVVQSGDWHPWSPSVLRANGPCPGTASPSCYYMYYTGLSAQFSTNCVAVATSPTPTGPFTDQGPLSGGMLDSSGRPIGCGDNAGYGNIDPAPFVDSDGSAYLYVSTDRACPAASTSCTSANSTLKPTISVIPLAPSLLAASGARQPLFSADQPWEQAPWAPVVEGPWMEKHNGTYYLFYSGGAWTGAYGMGYATLASPIGPATKAPGNPILSGTSQVFSPGGGSTVIGPDGGDWLLYHARVGGYAQPRQLFLDPVIWKPDGTVTIKGPSMGRDLSPVVSVPAAPRIEATGPAGAAASFSAAAVDYRGQPLAVGCSPAPGSVFPIGATTVTCTAVDSAGRVGSASFPVVVADTTPPVVSVPPEMTALATRRTGVVVRYRAAAVDAVDGPVPVRCAPPSGTRFAVGVTAVVCAATDRAGNTGTARSAVNVRLAPQVSGLSVSPRVFALAGRMVGGRCRPATRTNRHLRPCRRRVVVRVRFTLNVAAEVTVAVSRLSAGRMVGWSCRPPTRSNRHHRACTRLIPLAVRIVRTARPGPNGVNLDARAGAVALGPGTYQLSAVPAVSKPPTTTLQIKP